MNKQARLFWLLACTLFLVDTFLALPYKALGYSNGSDGWAPRLKSNGVTVGTVDYVSDQPNGHSGANRNLRTRVTFQYALSRVAATSNTEPLPVVIALHANGGNSGVFSNVWLDHRGKSILERRNNRGKEFIFVGVVGHPPIGRPIDDNEGNWHYHYTEYIFDVPDDGDPATDVHRVNHVQAIENVIARLDNDPGINIDTSRIYVAGFSGGGLMTHLLAMAG